MRDVLHTKLDEGAFGSLTNPVREGGRPEKKVWIASKSCNESRRASWRTVLGLKIEDVPVQPIIYQDKRPKSWEPLFGAPHVGQSVFITKMMRSGGVVVNVAMQYQTCAEAVSWRKEKGGFRFGRI